MLFDEALAYCASQEGTLVSIHSAEENSFLSGEISLTKKTLEFFLAYGYQNRQADDDIMFIGLIDRVQKGTFVWLDDTPVNYTNWASTEPNGGNNTALGLESNGSGQWWDGSDLARKRGICQLRSNMKLKPGKDGKNFFDPLSHIRTSSEKFFLADASSQCPCVVTSTTTLLPITESSTSAVTTLAPTPATCPTCPACLECPICQATEPISNFTDDCPSTSVTCPICPKSLVFFVCPDRVTTTVAASELITDSTNNNSATTLPTSEGCPGGWSFFSYTNACYMVRIHC